jgi:phage terminase large subunit-like protein
MENMKMKNDPIMQYLVATVQKRPLIDMLRDWKRDSKDIVEIDLIDDVIDAVLSGDFDG